MIRPEVVREPAGRGPAYVIGKLRLQQPLEVSPARGGAVPTPGIEHPPDMPHPRSVGRLRNPFRRPGQAGQIGQGVEEPRYAQPLLGGDPRDELEDVEAGVRIVGDLVVAFEPSRQLGLADAADAVVHEHVVPLTRRQRGRAAGQVLDVPQQGVRQRLALAHAIGEQIRRAVSGIKEARQVVHRCRRWHTATRHGVILPAQAPV
ncbi:hypothetical protein [Dactylosporangium sp. CA-139066]|uniref:hypothetical protein n=1 Tax=Dactylosporangium sp. CA-139066 TaxID=3239930 RepID=UPI003D8C52B0